MIGTIPATQSLQRRFVCGLPAWFLLYPSRALVLPHSYVTRNSKSAHQLIQHT